MFNNFVCEVYTVNKEYMDRKMKHTKIIMVPSLGEIFHYDAWDNLLNSCNLHLSAL